MSLNETGRADCQHARGTGITGLSDERIMAEIQAGNGDAFAVLFDRYHRLVLVTALRIVRDVAEAEEVTQSVFLEIYRAARDFDPARGSLKVWLLQFAYHRSINRRNYLTLRQFYDRRDIQEAVAWECLGAMTPHLAVQEAARLVEEALGILNEPQRRTIQMVFFEGMTLKEVAEHTTESLSNVRNHYYRGLDRLRLRLSTQSLKVGQDAGFTIREVGRAKA
jgi:RNA polymerase sigma-70 factor (ECF subfamily)